MDQKQLNLDIFNRKIWSDDASRDGFQIAPALPSQNTEYTNFTIPSYV